MLARGAPMILSADLIVFCSLFLSCFVAAPDQAVVKVHRLELMLDSNFKFCETVVFRHLKISTVTTRMLNIVRGSIADCSLLMFTLICIDEHV